MKKTYYLFTIGLSLLVMLSGCKSAEEPFDEPVNPTDEATISYTQGTVEITNSSFSVTTANIDAIAYLLTDDTSMEAPSAEDLFATGLGTMLDISDGTTTVELKNLAPTTSYQLFVAAQVVDADSQDAVYMEQVWNSTFTTKAYTEMITVLPADNNYSIKFHVEVPPGDTINYAVMTRDVYLTWQSYMWCDADLLSGHKGGNGSDATLNLLTESTDIVYDGYESEDYDTGEIYTVTPTPGEAYQILAAKVTASGVDYYGRETMAPPFDYDSWINEAWADPLLADSYWLTEYHASIMTNITPPTTLEGKDAEIDVIYHTTKSISFGVTPNADALMYSVWYYTLDNYNQMVEAFGYDGFINFSTNGGEIYGNEPFSFSVSDLEQGVSYKLVVIGNMSNDGLFNTVQIVDFTAAESTLSVPDMLVTPITAPEGYEESAWEVWYNVKCVSKDVTSIIYLANSVSEFEEYTAYGMTYNEMITLYGNAESTAYTMDAINSDEGYNFMFGSWEETENMLVVAGVNAEEAASNVDEDEGAIAYNTTIAEPAQPRVESDLFESLLGQWHVKFKAVQGFDATTYEPVLPSEYTYLDVNIVAAPEYPTTMPSDVYALYPNLTTEEVDALYQEFIAESEKFEGKIYGQNRLLIEGFNINDLAWSDAYTYRTPWDLFVSTEYSAAVTVSDLFYDFGPKWYLQIDDNDVVTVPADINKIAPMVNYNYNSANILAIGANTYNADVTEFETSISEDGNTISILPSTQSAEIDGFYMDVDYMFSVGLIYYGYAYPTVMCAEMELVRGAAPAALSAPYRVSYDKIATDVKVKTQHRKTSLKGAVNYGTERREISSFDYADYRNTIKSKLGISER